MMGWRIIPALHRWKSALADRLPAPMAAPETPQLRSVALGLLTVAWEPIAYSGMGRIAAFVWLVLALNALIVGARWLILKIRADDAWAARDDDE